MCTSTLYYIHVLQVVVPFYYKSIFRTGNIQEYQGIEILHKVIGINRKEVTSEIIYWKVFTTVKESDNNINVIEKKFYF